MIVANDPTVKGGTYFPLTVSQLNRFDTLRLTERGFHHQGEETFTGSASCS